MPKTLAHPISISQATALNVRHDILIGYVLITIGVLV